MSSDRRIRLSPEEIEEIHKALVKVGFGAEATREQRKLLRRFSKLRNGDYTKDRVKV